MLNQDAERSPKKIKRQNEIASRSQGGEGGQGRYRSIKSLKSNQGRCNQTNTSGRRVDKHKACSPFDSNVEAQGGKTATRKKNNKSNAKTRTEKKKIQKVSRDQKKSWQMD
jgi:hypothetical protein